MSCLYVFVDESGNLDFSPKGTKFFVLSAVTAVSPLDSSSKLQQLKYSLLASGNGGSEFEQFHASEDSQSIRDNVFNVIGAMTSIKINYVIAEKRKAHPKLHNHSFYGLLGRTLTKYLLLRYGNTDYQKIIVIFDKLLPKNSQDIFLKEIKPVLKEIGKPYAIYFHKTMSDFNGQIADYCAWAKYVSLERGELRPMKSLSSIAQESFDIFKTGNTFYY